MSSPPEPSPLLRLVRFIAAAQIAATFGMVWVVHHVWTHWDDDPGFAAMYRPAWEAAPGWVWQAAFVAAGLSQTPILWLRRAVSPAATVAFLVGGGVPIFWWTAAFWWSYVAAVVDGDGPFVPVMALCAWTMWSWMRVGLALLWAHAIAAESALRAVEPLERVVAALNGHGKQ